MLVQPFTGSHDRLPFVCQCLQLIGWLAQGKCAGELLLMMDAMRRAQRIDQEADGLGLFVDALDEHAAGFYQRDGFQCCPGQPLLLFLPTHHFA
ncbi:MAG: hypothetical protein COW02_06230 [Comamonadaceae bacterium CG12_big_fil_rev_8_21_14_0_65_59_15]|nr:MAG: hypothetical protein COW02_06230 [Comamonadaceae bacterium CG12_big_fil_rev_8_21_14_0_65_59_15]